MKLKLVIVALACMAMSANATVTINFSSSTVGALSNFQNGAGSSTDAGNVSNRLIWGILVDAGGDGFDALTSGISYNNGFSLAPNVNGIALSLNTSVVTDDVLYVGPAAMASSSTAINAPATGEVPANQNRILGFAGFTYNAALNVTAGDRIAIMWFDTLSATGTAAEGLKYGIYELPAVLFDASNFANVLPTDNGGTYAFGPAFVGADAAKPMNFVLGIPEPSAALLGAIGLLGLLRRRRN